MDLKVFHDRLRLRLPKYRKDLEEAGTQYGLDWRLLAAQAYQESHWNPNARSFTGVRGLMMLTLETAKDYGVKSRLNPKEVISAGASHLSRLHGRIRNEVPEPDRTFMALAAYNVGWGHLEDARTLATRLGRDPNSWHGVGLTLPLLRQKRYYRTLAHGYARGKEPVLYVDRIRTYYRVLVQHLEKSEQNPGVSERGQETTIP